MISAEQSKELNRIRLREAARSRAAEYQAISEADRINGWNRFRLVHSGQSGLKSGVYYSCEANDQLIESFLEEQEQLPITFETLEYAFRTLADSGSLAKFPKQEYQRKTNVKESRIAPQQRSYAPPEKAAPFTKDALLAMSKTELRKAVQTYGLDSINQILQGR